MRLAMPVSRVQMEARVLRVRWERSERQGSLASRGRQARRDLKAIRALLVKLEYPEITDLQDPRVQQALTDLRALEVRRAAQVRRVYGELLVRAARRARQARRVVPA